MGIRRLTAMIVTHQDSDHSGGALTILQTVPVDWLASSLPDGSRDPDAARADGAARRCAARPASAGRGTACASRAAADGRALRDASQLKPNDLSCVVRIESDHGSVLLTGDLEARGEQELVRRDAVALKADVLLVPHHGSRTSSTPAFIAAVAPDIAVYTPGYRNRFGHPRPDVVARYDARGRPNVIAPIYDGALTFTVCARCVERARAPSASTTGGTGATRLCAVREAARPTAGVELRGIRATIRQRAQLRKELQRTNEPDKCAAERSDIVHWSCRSSRWSLVRAVRRSAQERRAKA